MTRKEFIKYCKAIGIGLPVFLTLESCTDDEVSVTAPEFEVNFSGKVIIIGAGAAGLTAGYLLQRENIDFQILEASSVYGGRLKRADNFVDFPIDLGAEWIHTEPSILAEILTNPNIEANIDFITYNPQTISVWKNGKLKKNNWASNFYSEYKFKSTTWYGFFENYIVPDISDKIILNQPVTEIDYSTDMVNIKTNDGSVFEADKVLVTVPVKTLQDEYMDFIPSLPAEKISAINSIKMGDGLKAFIEFRERFYPDILNFGGLLTGNESDEKIFYDAAFRKDSDKNVLGLFTIGKPAGVYAALDTEQQVIDTIIGELDEIFDGKASENYINHVIQNWSKEPFIGGSYSTEFKNSRTGTMNTISEPVDNKIYFAGEALSDENQSTVHGASETAYSTVEVILKD